MPIGPDGQKRSADPLKAALEVVRIATGEQQETPKSASRRRRLRVIRKPAPENIPAQSHPD